MPFQRLIRNANGGYEKQNRYVSAILAALTAIIWIATLYCLVYPEGVSGDHVVPDAAYPAGADNP